MRREWRLLVLTLGCWMASAQASPVDFVRDVQPLFRAACHSCHGPKAQMAQLRLDSKPLAFRGGVSGPAILPKDAANSLLLQRVTGAGGKAQMPMAGTPLSPEQVDLIRRWIQEGATWPDEASVANAEIARHWAYIRPVRPRLPPVRNEAWVRNPIDRLVISRLEKEGLAPSPEASRETLIRRVSLDLTGLPPTIEQVDAFVGDPSPRAYENVVDRLLASAQYGEKWARPWLDLARYADTNGFADNRRTVWRYRDWVIDAFNRDLPFDQFTLEQLAGDLLPDATVEQKIATGFHRNTMFNDEGGVDAEEAHWLINVDRAATTATVWLGVTLGCAQCHNHKFDPFTQKDFYRLLAFFETADYKLDGRRPHEMYIEPVLELPTPEQAREQARLREEIAQWQKVIDTPTAELVEAQAAWEREQAPRQARWWLVDLAGSGCASGVRVQKQDDSWWTVTPGHDMDECRLTVETRRGTVAALQVEARAGSAFGLERVTADAGDGKAVQLRPASGGVFEWASPADSSGTLAVTIQLKRSGAKGDQLRFRVSVAGEAGTVAATPLPKAIREIVQQANRTPEQAAALAAYYRSIAPQLQHERDQVAQTSERLSKLPIVTSLVMGERRAEKRATHLRIRGSFLSKGELVDAGVPGVFGDAGASGPTNRLQLARWLVSEQNPLAARVAVNRFWEQIFGSGLVETAEDFGTRGAAPAHPELLDWLAVEFPSQGWSMKALLRLIVTSATYRQSSAVTPAALERDPANRLLARGPRFRLDAETLRDAGLAASGLLQGRMGGPPVFPYQPDGVWNQPYYKDYQWVNSTGGDAYRRGIYTFWRRTAPYPSFVNFDAPSREFCAVRRIRTNTPLQALSTLNDPAFFVMAKALGARLAARDGGSVRERATLGFRLCVSRRPEGKELDEMVILYTRQLARFQADPRAARELAGDAADPSFAAAWTVVANVLLNLDEALTKE